MEFVWENRIKTDKVINDLDKFVLKFIRILEKHAQYVIVSGYVSIFFGRSRATEDVDVIVKRMGKKPFSELYSGLVNEGFWCLNAEKPNDVFEYLEHNAVRFAEKGKVIPNMEFKFAKAESDFESLKNPMAAETSIGLLMLGNIELQIAFKRAVLCSDKDMEDAVHLEEIFKGRLNNYKIRDYEEWLKK